MGGPGKALKISEIATGARLEEFFGRIDTHLKDVRKRESFAMYACGILGAARRARQGRAENRAAKPILDVPEHGDTVE